jgi:hypothetical protein
MQDWNSALDFTSSFPLLDVAPTVPEITRALTEITCTLPEIEPTPPEIPPTLPEIMRALIEITRTLPDIEPTPPEIPSTLPEITRTLHEITRTLTEITRTLPEIEPTPPEIPPTLPKSMRTLAEIRCTLAEITRTLSEISPTLPKTLPLTCMLPEIPSALPEITRTLPEIMPTPPKILSTSSISTSIPETMPLTMAPATMGVAATKPLHIDSLATAIQFVKFLSEDFYLDSHRFLVPSHKDLPEFPTKELRPVYPYNQVDFWIDRHAIQAPGDCEGWARIILLGAKGIVHQLGLASTSVPPFVKNEDLANVVINVYDSFEQCVGQDIMSSVVNQGLLFQPVTSCS